MKNLFLLFFILPSFFCTAQQKKIDSLLTVCNNYNKEDSQKVVYLINVFKQYTRLNNFNKLQEFADKALTVAKKLPQTFSQTTIYERLGLCYHGKAKYLQAIEAYNNGIALAKKRNDKYVTASFYLNLGALYGSIPDYSKSLEAQQIAIALYTELGSTDNLSSSYMNMGDTYNSVNNPILAVAYINKALAIFKTQEDGLHYGTAIAYKGLALSYKIAADSDLIKLNIMPIERYNQCLTYLDSALKIAKNAESAKTLIGPINKDIGTIYENKGNIPIALSYYQSALKTIPQDEKEEYGNLIFTLGNFYYNISNFTKSKSYLQQSLTIGKETGLLLLQQNSLELLSAVFAKTNQYDSAFIFYKNSIAVKDSIFNADKEKEITRKQLQLDFSVKENDYKLVQQISDGKLQQQQLQIGFDKKVKIFLALLIALALLVGALIFYDRRKTKKLNIVINKQKIELEKLGSVKDKIFSVVSHDMRSPVNSLISFINILEDGNMPQEKLAIYAKELKQNLGYTSSLMNNLLNWAASQMQGFKPVKEKIDIATMVTEVANTLQHHWQPKNIIIKNTIATGTFINADANMTTAILRNLISNAIKYSYKNAEVIISTEYYTNGCNINIQDNGTGMQPEQLTIFNSNTQQQAESKRGTANEKGTGLGLLLCKTFTQQMGGKISAINNDKGTTFTISLPTETLPLS